MAHFTPLSFIFVATGGGQRATTFPQQVQANVSISHLSEHVDSWDVSSSEISLVSDLALPRTHTEHGLNARSLSGLNGRSVQDMPLVFLAFAAIYLVALAVYRVGNL